MRPNTFHHLWHIVLGIFLVLPLAVTAQQKIIKLDLARYYHRIIPNEYSGVGVVDYGLYESEHSGMFPNGSYYMWTVSNIKEAMLFGEIKLDDQLTYRGFDEAQGCEVCEESEDAYLDQEPFGVWEISKYAPPDVFVDGIPCAPEYTGVVDESIKADKMFRIFEKKSPWMHIRYEGYQFVNQHYGDFVILKSTYKLTFDDDYTPVIAADLDADVTQVIKDMYIFKAYRIGQTTYTGETDDDPSGRWFIHHGAWWASTMKVPSIIAGADRNELIVTYGFDGDHPSMSFTEGGVNYEDTGHPRGKPSPDGWLMSTPYSGFTLLHCDKAPDDKSDWVDGNPVSSHIRATFNDYRLLRAGGLWDEFVANPPEDPYEELPYPPAGDPIQQEGKQPAQIWGGWPEMQMNDSVTVVHALGSGSITRREAREVGAAWVNWFNSGDVPEAHWDHPDLGSVLVDDARKNEIVHWGKDSLALAMQRAQELWENDLICPRPYPSPDLYVNSAPNAVKLEWADVEQDYPGHEGGNVIAFRIYQKMGHYWDDDPNEAGKNLYWDMIKELDAGSLVKNDNGFFEYTDEGLTIGEDYYYAVTAVSDVRAGIDGTGGYLESSRWSNRTLLPAVPFRPGKSYMDSVVVVPNPYYIRGQLMNFVSDNNQLMFANLPPMCTLRIYNVTGDLIHTIEHSSGTAAEYWDQITETNQYIASGVYILAVTDAEKLVTDETTGGLVPVELPGKTIIKFTVIR